jgi:hypothetical protein
MLKGKYFPLPEKLLRENEVIFIIEGKELSISEKSIESTISSDIKALSLLIFKISLDFSNSTLFLFSFLSISSKVNEIHPNELFKKLINNYTLNKK